MVQKERKKEMQYVTLICLGDSEREGRKGLVPEK